MSNSWSNSIGCVILTRQFRYCDIVHLDYPLEKDYLKVYLTDAHDRKLIITYQSIRTTFQIKYGADTILTFCLNEKKCFDYVIRDILLLVPSDASGNYRISKPNFLRFLVKVMWRLIDCSLMFYAVLALIDS